MPPVMPAQPGPGAAAQSPPNIMPMILGLLSGAGFKDVSKGINDLAQSGTDLSTLTMMPGASFFLAGAGLKDAANSQEVLQPLLKMLAPPPPPPPPDPRQVSAAMAMLSSKLGQGQHGLQPPMGLPPMGPPPTPGGIGQSGY